MEEYRTEQEDDTEIDILASCFQHGMTISKRSDDKIKILYENAIETKLLTPIEQFECKEIITFIEPTTFTNIPIRASVEYNCMELIIALLLLYDNINNYENVLEKIETIKNEPSGYESVLFFNKKEDIIEYEKDVIKKKKIINKYITNFRNSVKIFNEFTSENIKEIFISGKINKHKEIEQINANLTKLEQKSDIYVKFINTKIVGISIKQSKSATKSNYSVQKMLGPDTNKSLTEIRKKYLHDNGIAHSDKSQRKKMNALFYQQNKENPYWIELKIQIENKKEEILKLLVDSLFCSNVIYDIYEFDGEQIIKLNEIFEKNNISFEEYLPYYFDKMGKERKTAKLFYRLTIEKHIFRVEIRWKGDIHNSSPQFQIHEE